MSGQYPGNLALMRRSFQHGARYNIGSYFGTLYTSLSRETARREMARYFTAAPRGGIAILLRLNRVVDLTDRWLLRKPGMEWGQLIGTRDAITLETELRAWESGIEALFGSSPRIPRSAICRYFRTTSAPCGRRRSWTKEATND